MSRELCPEYLQLQKWLAIWFRDLKTEGTNAIGLFYKGTTFSDKVSSFSFFSFRLIPKKLMSSYTGMEECEKTNTTTKRKM